ncbi:MAG: J domain-containing protein [Treponema sp.]|nr:J domain-containing protein [Treponema sp.]
MADFYGKLGDLLNEVLENQAIPQKSTTAPENKNPDSSIDSHKSEQNPNNFSITTETQNNSPSEIPEELKNPLKALEMTFPFTEEELRKKYHQLLLKYHPDKVHSKIENPKILYTLRQKQTEKITNAYNQLEQWLQEKK